MTVYFVMLLIMTLMGSVASLLLKKAASCDSAVALMRCSSLYVGAGLYFMSALVNIWVLQYLDYSVVLPLTSLTYVWTMGLSYYYLCEKITKRKMVGVVLIVAGAGLVSA